MIENEVPIDHSPTTTDRQSRRLHNDEGARGPSSNSFRREPSMPECRLGPSHEHPDNTATQESLLALSEGDTTRFAALFIRFAPRLKSYLMRLGVTPSAAEELAQETMLRVWRKSGGFNPDSGNGVGWIYRIARNLRIDAARKERHPDDIAGAANDETPPTPEEECLARERNRQLQAAIRELTPIQAEVLNRALLRHGTLAEIASDLELPLSTAKSHLRRAIAHIRKRLDQES